MPDDIISRIGRETDRIIDTEGLFIQAMQEIVRDEIKKRIDTKIEKNPELKQEIKIAVSDLIEARIKEASALMRLGKIAARVGIEMLPGELKEEVSREFASILEREIAEVFRKIS